MAVTADQDAGCRPHAPDHPDKAAQIAADLLAGRCLAGTQDHGEGPTCVVDVTAVRFKLGLG